MNRSHNSKSEQGMSLLIVLVVMTGVTIFAISLGGFVVSRLNRTKLEGKQKQAYYVARSAAMAIMDWIQQQDIAHLTAEERFPLEVERETDWHEFGTTGNKEYRARLRIDEDEILHLSVTGRVADGIRETVNLTAAPEGLFAGTDLNAALIGTESIRIRDNVTVTGMSGSQEENKSVEVYALEFNKQVTEGDYFISEKKTRIQGDVSVGSGTAEEVKQSMGTRLDAGEVIETEDLATYNLPLFPEFPEELPERDSLMVTEDRTIQEGGDYEQIVVTDGATLRIELEEENIDLRVDRLILGDNQGHSGEIKIEQEVEDSGRVNLFVENRLELNAESFINEINESTSDRQEEKAYQNLVLFYEAPDPDLRLEGSQRIVGNVYTRMADVRLSGSNSLLGNLISGAQEVTCQGNNFNQQSQGFARVIYAPQARVRLTTPEEAAKKDLISGVVIGRELIVGPRYQVHLFRVNIGQLPFNFQGGREYTEFRWHEE